MKNIAIIYHQSDFDGILSNEVCRHHLSRLYPNAAIHSYGWDYGRPVPLPTQMEAFVVDPGMRCYPEDWKYYHQIYIVDLSVDELMADPGLREKIIWIDHHQSSIRKYDGEAIAG